MTELPPSYWNDVNRYCGEILADAPANKVSLFVMSRVFQEKQWGAINPATTALLKRCTQRNLGGLAGKKTWHILRLQTDNESNEPTEHKIVFYPEQETITRAYIWHKFPDFDPDNITIRHTLQRRKQFNDRTKAITELGLNVPSLDDHEILLNELRHGVDQL